MPSLCPRCLRTVTTLTLWCRCPLLPPPRSCGRTVVSGSIASRRSSLALTVMRLAMLSPLKYQSCSLTRHTGCRMINTKTLTSFYRLGLDKSLSLLGGTLRSMFLTMFLTLLISSLSFLEKLPTISLCLQVSNPLTTKSWDSCKVTLPSLRHPLVSARQR